MNDRLYWLGWQVLMPGSGRRLWSLIEHFGSPEEAWKAPPKDLEGALRLDGERAADLARRRAAVDPVEFAAGLEKTGITFICYNEPGYPANLSFIYDPPAVLFARGSLKPDGLALAVVGSRKPTPYGRLVAEKIASDLAVAGVTVVSGAARGIDTAAHKGALAAGGRTVAVLGCGPDVVYPRENSRLLDQIAASGAILSEFPPGVQPEAWHFPTRNRIISGMAKGVLVVEAAEKSGALITADFALDQGRDVMAVPGNVTSPVSRGANRLIKQGAKLVEGAEDIFEEFGLDSLFPKTEGCEQVPVKLSDEEKQIYHLLSVEPVHLDELISRTGLSAGTAQAALMFLLTKGLAVKSAGDKYTCSGRKLF